MRTAHPELFPQPSAEARQALENLPAALDAVLPLKAAHRRSLPAAVQELSARLTCERGARERPYWSSPHLASAYLRYFLPWNLLRLIRLLGGLDLPCPPVDAAERTMVLDIGSGPLTLPLALWLARPEWRELPLDVVCLDSASRALDLGSALFAHLVGASPWRILPVRADIHAVARETRGRPWLISAVNVLNELKADRAPLEARLAAFAAQAARRLHERGALLCVEPGTRLGGRLVQTLREESLALGLAPARPCTHVRPCPLQGTRSWCHFSLGVQGAPDWLAQLAREARLPKKALHLSFALLRRQPVGRRDAARTDMPASTRILSGRAGGGVAPNSAASDQEAGRDVRLAARVLSAPFSVPGLEGLARYACSAQGLVLLTRAAKAPTGALVEASWPARPRRDERSGAWII